MPTVNALHPSYKAWLPKWQKCRDAVEGQEAIKAKREAYLPRLGGQESGEYDAYLSRAVWYAISERTLVGLVGTIMRKPPIKEFPDLGYLDSIGAAGESLEELASLVCEEVIGIGRVGLYVDSPEDSDNPYIAVYYAENIINWRFAVIDGERVPILVVLQEDTEEVDAGDEYVTNVVTYYRVLRLEDNGSDTYTYKVEVWKDTRDEKDKARKMVLISEVYPRMKGGRSLDRIPFTFVSPSGTADELVNPPILPVVNVNISLFHTSADLEHGRHWTALPTAWTAGKFNADDRQGTLKIGSSVVWESEDTQAKAGYLEFTGEGLRHLADAQDEKRKMAAVLGARLLEQRSADVEAYQTVALRQRGESSILANISNHVSEGITEALGWAATWLNLAGEASCVLNTDFDQISLDPQMFGKLLEAVTLGKISYSTFYYQLKKGEIYPDSMTEEQERGLIDTENEGRDVGILDGQEE
jgi:hypothetical protein